MIGSGNGQEEDSVSDDTSEETGSILLFRFSELAVL